MTLMQRIVTCLALCSLSLTTAAVSTPEVVTTFYGGMKQLSSTRDANTVAALKLKMMKCFYGHDGNSGIDLPNDFHYFDIDKESLSHNDSILSANNYIAKLSRFLHEQRSLEVSYTVLSNTVDGAVPDLKGRKQSQVDAFVVTCVQKTYRSLLNNHSYNDTVTTCLATNLISRITNGNGAKGKEDVNTLRIRAARAYAAKNYDEAYHCYESIVQQDPNDCAALYYIGLMTFWGQGCKNLYPNKGKRKKKAEEYLSQATQRGNDWNMRSKARHALTIVKHGGDVYF